MWNVMVDLRLEKRNRLEVGIEVFSNSTGRITAVVITENTAFFSLNCLARIRNVTGS
jgi:hypothetical protein